MFHRSLNGYCSYCAAILVTGTSEKKHHDLGDATQCRGIIALTKC